MILIKCMPIVIKAFTGIRSKGIISIRRTVVSSPPVTVNVIGIDVTNITRAEMNSELWWQKCTIGLLRFRWESEEKNNEYKTRLLQVSCTLLLKLLQNGDYFSNDWMKGIIFNCSYTDILAKYKPIKIKQLSILLPKFLCFFFVNKGFSELARFFKRYYWSIIKNFFYEYKSYSRRNDTSVQRESIHWWKDVWSSAW